MTDIFEELRKDHAEVEGILARLEVAAPVTGPALEERRKVVDTLIMEESRHEAAEEQYFWPTVKENLSNGESLAEKALQQEQEGKEVLDKLDGMSPQDPQFEALIAKFVKAGREHIAYEQDVVWPPLQTVLTEEDRKELGEKFEQAKKMGPTRPHPNTPPSPAALKTAGMVAGMADKARDAMSNRGR